MCSQPFKSITEHMSITRCRIHTNRGQTASWDSYSVGGVMLYFSRDVSIFGSSINGNHASARVWDLQTGGIFISRVFSSMRLSLSSVTFSANVAGNLHTDRRKGFYEHGSYVENCTFRGPRTRKSSVVVQGWLPWKCPPGTWMPHAGRFDDEFTGCLYECAAGFYGNTTSLPQLTDAQCSGACPKGRTPLQVRTGART